MKKEERIKVKEERIEILKNIVGKEPMLAKEMAEKSGLANGVAYRLLQEMVESGLISRRYVTMDNNYNNRGQWYYYCGNKEMDELDDELSVKEWVMEMLKSGEAVSYKMENAPKGLDKSLGMHLSWLRRHGWNIGERIVEKYGYKEFYLIKE